jgi:hypothetical protein
MSVTESVPIDHTNVASVARETAANAKLFAALLIAVAGLFVVAAATMKHKHGVGAAIGGIGFWVVVFGGFGARFLRQARRAEGAIRLVESRSPHQFFLSDRMIVVASDAGALRPEMSFKISKRLRSMLLAVPRASVHRG